MSRSSVREQLVDSAGGTFRRKGVHGASVLDISTDAGVPKGSVYNHFDNKEALAVEVLQRYVAETRGDLERGHGAAIDRLREHLEWQIARTRGTGLEHGCLLGNFAVEVEDGSYPVLKAAVRDSFETWIDGVSGLIAQARRDGDVTNGRDDRELASWVIASLEGMTSLAKALGDGAPLASFVEITLEMLHPAAEPASWSGTPGSARGRGGPLPPV